MHLEMPVIDGIIKNRPDSENNVEIRGPGNRGQEHFLHVLVLANEITYTEYQASQLQLEMPLCLS